MPTAAVMWLLSAHSGGMPAFNAAWLFCASGKTVADPLLCPQAVRSCSHTVLSFAPVCREGSVSMLPTCLLLAL